MPQHKHTFVAVAGLLLATATAAAADFSPQVNGVIRTKFEYEPQIEQGRFEVRNARLCITGKAQPTLSYKAEIDLCDEGNIKMLDAYIRWIPSAITLTVGQMRVPFTIDAHRSPHLQYFVNRSFIAKHVANVRDVGMAVRWQPAGVLQWNLEGGVFNGSGLTGQKDYWTKTFNFNLKTYATLADRWHVEASLQRIKPETITITMWDIGTYYDNGRWHVEAEYLRKNYAHGSFNAVNAVNAFIARRFSLKCAGITSISALARFDSMDDHSSGNLNDDGVLQTDNLGRRRITAGSTIHLGSDPVYCDLRVNYEKYFYGHRSTQADISDRDKAVIELVCRF